MSMKSESTSELVDQLDHAALLELAGAKADENGPRPPYSLPSAKQLQKVFPELEVGDVLGTGGMGCVYRAVQLKLDRIVALKILPPELAVDDHFAERFGREARAMARLNHPGIISVYDFGKAGEFHYLIMEYMDGMNLRQLLDAGPIEAVEALRIFEQVCLALAYAHGEGVVHRDIKPENILFDRIGHVALADFGLVRLAVDSNCEVSLTQTRQTMGTLNYMAPEQWEDPRSVDHRADIYALGVLLYELLTGRVPRGSFPPASSVSDAPGVVDEVINRALQVDADDRFQCVADLVETLAGAQSAGSDSEKEEYRFSAHGTATNFMHLGAAVLDRIPVPRKVPGKSKEGVQPYTIMQLALLILVLSTIVMMFTWHNYDPGITCVTDDFVGYFVAPNVLMPVELILVCLLTWKSSRIHPIRARFLCLVLLGFCIAQIAQFTFDRHGTDYSNLTIAPFIYLVLVSLLALEFVVRTLSDIHKWYNSVDSEKVTQI